MIEFSYIHIPFCAQKCKYCGFTSFVNTGAIEKYINSLLFEIDKRYNDIPQKGIYIGGGTPSLLSLNQIEAIIKKFNTKGEITVEINPENASKDYFSGLLDIGVNRISIGIQAFDDKILTEMGRCHSAQCGILAVENSRRAGFSNVSIDLMYGLVGQSLENWKDSLETACGLGVEHISAYGLKIEENTYYGKFYPKNLPDDEIQAEMYKMTLEILGGINHFYRYEISNFAKNENFISKHNLNYWNHGCYNGFGLGACGFEGNIRYKNTTKIKDYFENPLKREEEAILTVNELLEEAIFLGFRRFEGINTQLLNEKFGINFYEKYKNIIEKYSKSGHIVKTEIGYRLSVEGVLASNCILCEFLC